MTEGIRRSLVSSGSLASAFLITAAIGLAQPTTQLDLTGLTGPSGVTSSASDCYSLAYVCTSPYVAEVGGSSVSTNVICDDFFDESFVPEDWNAYVATMSPSSYTITNGSNLLYTGATVTNPNNTSQTLTLNQQQAYETAALLAEDILAINPPSQLSAALDSYALWGLFDPTGSQVDSPNNLGAFTWLDYYGVSSTEITSAETVLWDAAETILSPTGTAALDGATVTIYSYDSCISGPCTSTRPQEFIVVSNMPEPPSVAMLGADLLAVAGLFFFFRRRLDRN